MSWTRWIRFSRGSFEVTDAGTVGPELNEVLYRLHRAVAGDGSSRVLLEGRPEEHPGVGELCEDGRGQTCPGPLARRRLVCTGGRRWIRYRANAKQVASAGGLAL